MSSLNRTRTDKEPLSGRKLRERAFDLLSRRDHSERELIRKLTEKGSVVDELPALIEDLRERGFLDDVRFAENFVRFRVGKAWGPRRYRQELLVRGVRADIVDSVLAGLPDFHEEKLTLKIRELVGRELGRGKSEEKIIASMLRRGFAAGAVRDAYQKLSKDKLVNEPSDDGYFST